MKCQQLQAIFMPLLYDFKFAFPLLFCTQICLAKLFSFANYIISSPFWKLYLFFWLNKDICNITCLYFHVKDALCVFLFLFGIFFA